MANDSPIIYIGSTGPLLTGKEIKVIYFVINTAGQSSSAKTSESATPVASASPTATPSPGASASAKSTIDRSPEGWDYPWDSFSNDNDELDMKFDFWFFDASGTFLKSISVSLDNYVPAGASEMAGENFKRALKEIKYLLKKHQAPPEHYDGGTDANTTHHTGSAILHSISQRGFPLAHALGVSAWLPLQDLPENNVGYIAAIPQPNGYIEQKGDGKSLKANGESGANRELSLLYKLVSPYSGKKPKASFQLQLQVLPCRLDSPDMPYGFSKADLASPFLKLDGVAFLENQALDNTSAAADHEVRVPSNWRLHLPATMGQAFDFMALLLASVDYRKPDPVPKGDKTNPPDSSEIVVTGSVPEAREFIVTHAWDDRASLGLDLSALVPTQKSSSGERIIPSSLAEVALMVLATDKTLSDQQWDAITKITKAATAAAKPSFDDCRKRLLAELKCQPDGMYPGLASFLGANPLTSITLGMLKSFQMFMRNEDVLLDLFLWQWASVATTFDAKTKEAWTTLVGDSLNISTPWPNDWVVPNAVKGRLRSGIAKTGRGFFVRYGDALASKSSLVVAINTTEHILENHNKKPVKKAPATISELIEDAVKQACATYLNNSAGDPNKWKVKSRGDETAERIKFIGEVARSILTEGRTPVRPFILDATEPPPKGPAVLGDATPRLLIALPALDYKNSAGEANAKGLDCGLSGVIIFTRRIPEPPDRFGIKDTTEWQCLSVGSLYLHNNPQNEVGEQVWPTEDTHSPCLIPRSVSGSDDDYPAPRVIDFHGTPLGAEPVQLRYYSAAVTGDQGSAQFWLLYRQSLKMINKWGLLPRLRYSNKCIYQFLIAGVHRSGALHFLLVAENQNNLAALTSPSKVQEHAAEVLKSQALKPDSSIVQLRKLLRTVGLSSLRMVDGNDGKSALKFPPIPNGVAPMTYELPPTDGTWRPKNLDKRPHILLLHQNSKNPTKIILRSPPTNVENWNCWVCPEKSADDKDREIEVITVAAMATTNKIIGDLKRSKNPAAAAGYLDDFAVAGAHIQIHRIYPPAGPNDFLDKVYPFPAPKLPSPWPPPPPAPPVGSQTGEALDQFDLANLYPDEEPAIPSEQRTLILEWVQRPGVPLQVQRDAKLSTGKIEADRSVTLTVAPGEVWRVSVAPSILQSDVPRFDGDALPLGDRVTVSDGHLYIRSAEQTFFVESAHLAPAELRLVPGQRILPNPALLLKSLKLSADEITRRLRVDLLPEWKLMATEKDFLLWAYVSTLEVVVQPWRWNGLPPWSVAATDKGIDVVSLLHPEKFEQYIGLLDQPGGGGTWSLDDFQKAEIRAYADRLDTDAISHQATVSYIPAVITAADLGYLTPLIEMVEGSGTDDLTKWAQEEFAGLGTIETNYAASWLTGPLNQLLNGNLLGQESAFAKRLSPDTQDLLKTKPTGELRRRANRMVLADAFALKDPTHPDPIRKFPRRQFLLFQDHGEQESFPRYFRVKVTAFSRYSGLPGYDQAFVVGKVGPTTTSWRRCLIKGRLQKELGVPRVKMVLPLLEGAPGQSGEGPKRPGVIVLSRDPLPSPFHTLVAKMTIVTTHFDFNGGHAQFSDKKSPQLPEIGLDPITSTEGFEKSYGTDVPTYDLIGRAFGLTFEREAGAPLFANSGFLFEALPKGIEDVLLNQHSESGRISDLFLKLQFRWEIAGGMESMDSPNTPVKAPAEQNSWAGDDKIYSDVGPLTAPWEVRLLAPFEGVDIYPNGTVSFDKLQFRLDKDGDAQFVSDSKQVYPVPPGGNTSNFGLLFAVYREVPDFLSARPGTAFESLHYIDKRGKTTRLYVSTSSTPANGQPPATSSEECNAANTSLPSLYGMFLLLLFEPAHPSLKPSTGVVSDPDPVQRKVFVFEGDILKKPDDPNLFLQFLFPEDDTSKPSSEAQAMTVRLGKPISYQA